MLILLLSLVFLVVGPALVLWVPNNRRAGSMIHGVVVATLIGLVAGDVLPESMEVGGPWVLLSAAIGLAAPYAIEHLVMGGHHHHAIATLGLLGLAAHGLVDGAVMGVQTTMASGLAWGVAIHRLPIGFAIWARLPRRAAIVVLVAVALATIFGFWYGRTVLDVSQTALWGHLAALFAGLLLHVAFEPPSRAGEQGKRGLLWALCGAVLGATFVLVHTHS